MGGCCDGTTVVEIQQQPTIFPAHSLTDYNIGEVAARVATVSGLPQQFSQDVKQIIMANQPYDLLKLDIEFQKRTGHSIAEYLVKHDYEPAHATERTQEIQIVSTLLSDQNTLMLEQIARLPELCPPYTWFVMGLFFGLSEQYASALNLACKTKYQGQSIFQRAVEVLEVCSFERTVMRKYCDFRFVRLDSDEAVVSNLIYHCKAKNMDRDRLVFLLIQLRDRPACHARFEICFMQAFGQDIYTFFRIHFEPSESVVIRLLFDIIVHREKALLDLIYDMLNQNDADASDCCSDEYNSRSFKFDLQMLLAYTHFFRFLIDMKNQFPQFKDMLFQHIKGPNYRYILDLWGIE